MADAPRTAAPRTDALRAAALRVHETLARAGYRALLAGGCVRDEMLGVPPRDYDIATSARPEQVAALFDRCIEVGAAFGIQIVVLPEGQFEVATFRRDGPYSDGRRRDYVDYVDEIQDARRRDFTGNAMFLDPADGQIIDHVGGRQDLDACTLRAVGDPKARFEEDHLRLLRAVRFAARLDYAIEPNTLEAMNRMAPLVTRPSAERIRDELVKILTEGGARRAFERLDETGMIEHVLPEVAAMKGVAQPERFHPEGDVFEHTLLMLERLEQPSATLAVGVLLHDVGKPITQTFEDRIRFNNHDKVGARESERICRRLRMSLADTARVSWLVENHMRLAAFPQMREAKRKRFVRHEGFPDLLELARLDCLASHRNLDKVEAIQDYAAKLPPEELKPRPLLTGQDLIDLGYAPGPLFSEILDAVEDAQLEGGLTSADDARRFAQEGWPVP